MRFSLIALPALAVAVSAAAVAAPEGASADPTTTTTQRPATVTNTSSAINSVASYMSSQSPKKSHSASAASTTTGDAGKGAKGHKKTSSPTPTPTHAHKKEGKHSTTTTKGDKGKKPDPTSSTNKPTQSGDSKKKVAARQAQSGGVNGACSPQPNVYTGYTPSNNYPNQTAIIKAYLGDSVFAAASKNAVTPNGYSWIYQGFYAQVNKMGYLSYTYQSSYNVTACSTICDNTPSCQSFTIFYARNPSLAVAPACSNPSPITNVVCTFYNSPLTVNDANNPGEYRLDFAVVTTGANAYAKPKAT